MLVDADFQLRASQVCACCSGLIPGQLLTQVRGAGPAHLIGKLAAHLCVQHVVGAFKYLEGSRVDDGATGDVVERVAFGADQLQQRLRRLLKVVRGHRLDRAGGLPGPRQVGRLPGILRTPQAQRAGAGPLALEPGDAGLHLVVGQQLSA